MAKNDEYFNLAHIEPESYIYGPGMRYVIWMQGCSLACKGCWNKEMWSVRPNKLIHREVLLKDILSVSGIRGITLLGGEPLEQQANLFWLLKKIRENSNLTIFLFTGYEVNEIESMNMSDALEQLCDILALGRYSEEFRNIDQQWIGSDNQVVVYPFNSREIDKPKQINQVEILIDNDSKMTIKGFPDKNLLDAITNH